MSDPFEQLQREAREKARRLALLGDAAKRARAYVVDGRVRGHADALLILFDASPVWSVGEIAAALGISTASAAQAVRRCEFIEHTDYDKWQVVLERTAPTRERQRREAEERERARIDAPRLAPFRNSIGRIKHKQQANAMRALFADGRERSTREIALAFGWDMGCAAELLRLNVAVEPAGVDMWRLSPDSPEVAALRAEIQRLRLRVVELEGLVLRG